MVASWDGFRDELVVYTSTQGAHGVRGFLSRALGLPENQVRVVMGDVGGGFGQKMFTIPEELAVVLAGKRLGRPVKWIEDRRENLMAGQHARDDRMTVSMALDADGHILGAAADLVEDVGAFPAAGSSATASSGCSSPGPTDPADRVLGPGRLHQHVRALRLPRPVDDGDRGPRADDGHRRPRSSASTRWSCAGATSSTRPSCRTRRRPGWSTTRCRSRASLEQAAEMIGYDAFRAEQAAARAEGRLLGIGLGLYVEPSGLAMGNWPARARSSASASTARCRP